MKNEVLGWAAALLSSVGFAGVAYSMARKRPLPRPTLGVRGLHRAHALESLMFRALEPVVRYVGAWFVRLPKGGWWHRLERQLVVSNHDRGLSPEEFVALTAIASVSASMFGFAIVHAASLHFGCGVLFTVAGALSPWLRLRRAARSRVNKIEVALPASVDLTSLCMSAGLDFPGALRQIVEGAARRADPLIEEYDRILCELQLGFTRRQAMERLAARVPSESVAQFCGSVIQAEQKGSPLVDVLAIQAQTQRLRRSLAAEERASGTALMLIGPMALAFLCVILLVVAPLVVRFSAGEFQVS